MPEFEKLKRPRPARKVKRVAVRRPLPSLGRGPGDGRDVLYNPDDDPEVRAQKSAGRANVLAARQRVGQPRTVRPRTLGDALDEAIAAKQRAAAIVAKKAAAAKQAAGSLKAAARSGLGEAEFEEGDLGALLHPPAVKKAVPVIAGPAVKAVQAPPGPLPTSPDEVRQYYIAKFGALRQRITQQLKSGKGFDELNKKMTVRRNSLQALLASGQPINYGSVVSALDSDYVLYQQKATELETSLVYATKNRAEISKLLDDGTQSVPANLHLEVSASYVSAADKDDKGVGQEYRLLGVDGVRWVLHTHYNNNGKLKDVHLKTAEEAKISATGITVHYTDKIVRAKLEALGVKYDKPTIQKDRVKYRGKFLTSDEFDDYSKTGNLPKR